jgi:excisionase family DNA binding protein
MLEGVVVAGAREGLLSVAEVADYFGVPVKTIYRWRLAGDGPRAARIGRNLKFRPEDVRAWVEEQLDADHGRTGRARI